MSERLPLVEAPFVVCSPTAAGMLLRVWDGATVPELRRRGIEVPKDLPPQLVDFIDACRVVAGHPVSDGGSAVDSEGEAGAGSTDATTSEGGRFTTTAECQRQPKSDPLAAGEI